MSAHRSPDDDAIATRAPIEGRRTEEGPIEGRRTETSSRRALAGDLLFGIDDLVTLRRLVRGCASEAGIDGQRLDDLVLAVNELASNSIRHGGGHGLLELWVEEDRVVCAVSDRGHIVPPPLGRIRPAPDQLSGRGLWLVEQLTDRVEIRSSILEGSTVRVSMQIA